MLNICGIIAFFMMYMYDLNLIYFRRKILNKCFMFGTVLLILSTLINLAINFPEILEVKVLIFLIMALLSLGGLIYTLFFALEFKDAYQNDNCNQTCTTTGMYALCRHPGVIWMFMMYLFLYLAIPASDMFFMVVAFNILNLGYVVMQDLIVFPKQFNDYQQYKKQTPFLIPTIKSIKECINSFRGKSNEI